MAAQASALQLQDEETTQAALSQATGSRKRIWFSQGMGLAALMLIGAAAMRSLQTEALPVSEKSSDHSAAAFLPLKPAMLNQPLKESPMRRPLANALSAADGTKVHPKAGAWPVFQSPNALRNFPQVEDRANLLRNQQEGNGSPGKQFSQGVLPAAQSVGTSFQSSERLRWHTPTISLERAGFQSPEELRGDTPALRQWEIGQSVRVPPILMQDGEDDLQPADRMAPTAPAVAGARASQGKHAPAQNPLQWPSIDQLGKKFYENLKPALEQLASGADKIDGKAERRMALLKTWLDSPCVATVKVDGTNVGISDDGLIVGRRQVLAPGQSYQKVDIDPLLRPYVRKAGDIREEIAHAASVAAVVGSTPAAQRVGSALVSASMGRLMLYGELVVNKKYNYADAGIFKDWLCFGVAVAPATLSGAEVDDEAALRLATVLRDGGFNAKASEENIVVIAPNAKLAGLLQKHQIHSVFDGYQPAGTTKPEQAIGSIRELVLSDWARSVLMPEDGIALGEGLVVASEADGTLFKWKNAGEEPGTVPERLAEATEALRNISASSKADILPPGLLEVFERLSLLAQKSPAMAAKEADAAQKSKDKPKHVFDKEAIAAWESTLTKFDSPESVFGQGREAYKAMEAELIKQVAEDLVKDYEAAEADAQLRAKRIVSPSLGKRFGIWQREATAQREADAMKTA